MLNILIVEDEFAIALDLKKRLKSMNYEVAGIAHDYNEALPLLLEKKIDIAILDINLNKEKSGIDLGILIYNKINLPIIFLSAYSDEETYKEAVAAHPMGFLTKPFKDEDLKLSLEIAVERFKEAKSTQKTNFEETDSKILFVKDKGQLSKINTDDILWLEAMHNYTIIHIKKGRHIANAFLKNVLQKLDKNNFVRIHKSHGVAIDKITKIEENLVFIDDIYLPVSRRYRKELFNKLNLL